jgi:magnesium transporter
MSSGVYLEVRADRLRQPAPVPLGEHHVAVAPTPMAGVVGASLVGAGLPFAARAAGIDPALISSPFVTTLVDATGLLIYFLIAELVLDV